MTGISPACTGTVARPGASPAGRPAGPAWPGSTPSTAGPTSSWRPADGAAPRDRDRRVPVTGLGARRRWLLPGSTTTSWSSPRPTAGSSSCASPAVAVRVAVARRACALAPAVVARRQPGRLRDRARRRVRRRGRRPRRRRVAPARVARRLRLGPDVVARRSHARLARVGPARHAVGRVAHHRRVDDPTRPRRSSPAATRWRRSAAVRADGRRARVRRATPTAG